MHCSWVAAFAVILGRLKLSVCRRLATMESGASAGLNVFLRVVQLGIAALPTVTTWVPLVVHVSDLHCDREYYLLPY